MSASRLPFLRPAFFAASVAHLFPLTGAALAGSEDAAGVRLPFPASVESVVERGAIEGYPVSVLRVRTSLETDQAVSSARRAWGGAHLDAVVVARSGAWQVVSVRTPSGYRTLQLRATPDGGSEGLLSVWTDRAVAARDSGSAPDAGEWLPVGAQVLRRVDGVDGLRRHRTVVALVEGSVPWVAQALDARIRGRGFVRDPVARPVSEAAQSRLYRASGRELAFTAHSHDGRVAVVIHLTEPAP